MHAMYQCPPECNDEHDPIHCAKSRRMELCRAHLIRHPADERCPECAGLIAAGL